MRTNTVKFGLKVAEKREGVEKIVDLKKESDED